MHLIPPLCLSLLLLTTSITYASSTTTPEQESDILNGPRKLFSTANTWMGNGFKLPELPRIPASAQDVDPATSGVLPTALTQHLPDGIHLSHGLKVKLVRLRQKYPFLAGISRILAATSVALAYIMFTGMAYPLMGLFLILSGVFAAAGFDLLQVHDTDKEFLELNKDVKLHTSGMKKWWMRKKKEWFKEDGKKENAVKDIKDDAIDVRLEMKEPIQIADKALGSDAIVKSVVDANISTNQDPTCTPSGRTMLLRLARSHLSDYHALMLNYLHDHPSKIRTHLDKMRFEIPEKLHAWWDRVRSKVKEVIRKGKERLVKMLGGRLEEPWEKESDKKERMARNALAKLCVDAGGSLQVSPEEGIDVAA